jgi:hydroxymethylglutaryl-CoA reductase
MTSRIPGFYRLPLDERLRVIAELTDIGLAELLEGLQTGGLTPELADKMVENALGVYGLPFGIALNVRVNEKDRLVPMVVEEPSVIAAASNAARMVRAGGGFEAQVMDTLMTGQVQVYDVREPHVAIARLLEAREELLDLARAAVPGLVARGGGPKHLEVRDLGQGMLVLHVLVECADAMGANLVNQVAEALGPRTAELTSSKLGLRILTNLSDQRRVRITCRVPKAELTLRADRGGSTFPPPDDPEHNEQILEAIVQASRFADADPYRAATHNKGIMNGIDAVVLATGNDFRAVEAGAHAYAAQSGCYRPLSRWSRDGDMLRGELELPLALGMVGGTLRVHPVAQLALRILRPEGANALAAIAASVGLASNLAALRALATEGIQRGHMSLHARSVAAAAGAQGAEVEEVAAALAAASSFTLEAAREALLCLRAAHD